MTVFVVPHKFSGGINSKAGQQSRRHLKTIIVKYERTCDMSERICGTDEKLDRTYPTNVVLTSKY